jgi:outer membrane protein OmpA-like peptidoglycan-associated protein
MDVSNAPEMPTSLTSDSGSVAGAPGASNAPPSPPTIVCSPSPANVRTGESATISCNATSPDNRPVRVQFSTSGGKLSSSGNRATLDTAQAGSGPIEVRAVATDDRDLSASTTATVNVEPPALAPATTQKAIDLNYAANSARVDNASKAVLDDVALKLQQDPGATVVLAGETEGTEPASLGLRRAQNARDYLVTSKGIDSSRITVKSSTQKSRAVEIWIVPAGASMPK